MRHYNHRRAILWLGIAMIALGTLLSLYVITAPLHASNSDTYITVPATIDGYDTIGLLHYVAKLKSLNAVQIPPIKTPDQLRSQYEVLNPQPVCKALNQEDSRVTYLRCNKLRNDYQAKEQAYINTALSLQ